MIEIVTNCKDMIRQTQKTLDKAKNIAARNPRLALKILSTLPSEKDGEELKWLFSEIREMRRGVSRALDKLAKDRRRKKRNESKLKGPRVGVNITTLEINARETSGLRRG
jgi:hypothetical protein